MRTVPRRRARPVDVQIAQVARRFARGVLRAAWLFAVLLVALPLAAPAAPTEPEGAGALRARYAALRTQLEHSPFQQQLYVESAEDPHELRGDVYAVVDYPIATVSSALTSPAHWCDLLILQLNVKYCRPAASGPQAPLTVAIGRKVDQPLDDAFTVEFLFAIAAAAPHYFAIDLAADKGPFGTTRYGLTLEAVDIDPSRAFLHLRFSYRYGLQARLAMNAYLATTGAGKVGFTRLDSSGTGATGFVAGTRGAIERNAMRYYLAVEAYLYALAVPPEQRIEQSLERWFDATERYPRQLHEVDRATYLAMKRREYQRQHPSR